LTLAVAVPPVPVQARVYVLVAVNAAVNTVPEVALLPDHAPEAVHEVASVELHVSVAVLPEVTVLGDADSLTVGSGGGVVTVGTPYVSTSEVRVGVMVVSVVVNLACIFR